MEVPMQLQETVDATVEKPPLQFHTEEELNGISVMSTPNTTSQSIPNGTPLVGFQLPNTSDTSYSSKIPLNMEAENDRVNRKINRPRGKSGGFWKNFKVSSGRAFVDDLTSCQCFSCCPLGRRRTIQPQWRTVIPNHLISSDSTANSTHSSRKYRGNKIKTTKYTFFTFLPKNLFEQFHRFANLYFIGIVLLNWIPAVEAFGKELSVIPIVFVLSVTALKDIFEDRRRYNSDQKINHSVCRVYDAKEKKYIPREWHEVTVGDLIHLSCNEIIPADILLLCSSDPMGMCYVETSNLDGESNLKQRQVVSGLADKLLPHSGGKAKACDFTGTVQCELPNNQIYKFNGFLLNSDGSREPINKNNLLLRGCELKNTDFVEGVVVYAGHETKAMLNNSGPRYKRSRLERIMNWDIMWCVVILFVLCLIGALGSGIWLTLFTVPLSDVLFLPFPSTGATTPALEAFTNFWSYVIVLQVMIPISLYVSLEMVKLALVFFISQDIHLYHSGSDKRIQCRALNIPEELGQVEYVLSDKTGTLTENKMIFRRCTVGGKDYGPAEIDSTREQAIPDAGEPSFQETAQDVKANVTLQQLIHSFADDYRCGRLELSKKAALMEFFINMAICNTVVVSPHPHHDKMTKSGNLLDSDPDGNSVRHFADSAIATPNGDMSRSTLALIDTNANYHTQESLHVGNGTVPLTTAHANEGFTSNTTPSIEELPHGDTQLADDQQMLTSRRGFQTLVGDEPTIVKMRNAKSVPMIVTEGVATAADNSADEMTDDERVAEGAATLTKHHSFGANFFDHMRKSDNSGHSSPNSSFRPMSLNMVNQAARKLLEIPTGFGKKFRLPPLWGSNKSLASPGPSPGFLNPYYEAESPDELALVYASAVYGVRLIKRHVNYCTVEMPDGARQKYEILHILPFDSVRKRMSVIIRQPLTNKLVLYCKGADSVILDLLSRQFQMSKRGQNCIYKSQENINLYASWGLRTLCLAKRVLEEDDYQTWALLHSEAEMALEDREREIFESACRIERDLELLGVTGIEDRLQDGVPECIAALRSGGLKVWVLTGDKIETAVNIAYACRLFTYGMELIQLSAKNEEDVDALLQHHIDGLSDRNRRSRSTAQQNDSGISTGQAGIGLVIDGRTLAYCLSAALEPKLVQLIAKCTSVLCCRTTPLQKASVVKLVKDKLQGMTLAIGDGANDVSMIQSADVGIGISGQEGMQAVMSSDFAMARFKFLHRLLFVHGHWCYDRLARMVLYFFYKNALFVFTLFWFQVFNGWSAQVMIDPLYLQLFNLVFTSLPPLLFGAFNQDAPDDLLIKNPTLYQQGMRSQLYRTYSFWLVIADALWQSCVVFFVPYFLYQTTDNDLWNFGAVVTSALVWINQFHLAIEINSWTWPVLLSLVFSVVVFYGFALSYNAVAIFAACCAPNAPYMVAESLFISPLYWFILIISIVLGLMPRFTFRALYNTVNPSDVLIARLKERKGQKSVINRVARHLFAVPFAKFTNKTKKVSLVISSAAHGIRPNSEDSRL